MFYLTKSFSNEKQYFSLADKRFYKSSKRATEFLTFSSAYAAMVARWGINYEQFGMVIAVSDKYEQ